MPDINYLAVLGAAIASIVIGSIWFGPLFGNTFMKGVGMDTWDAAKKQTMKDRMAWTYLQQFIMSLLMAFVFAHILWAFSVAMPNQSAFMAGVQGGFWIWLGIALPIRYGEALWNGQEFKYTAIDLGYWLVLSVVYGLILSFWK